VTNFCCYRHQAASRLGGTVICLTNSQTVSMTKVHNLPLCCLLLTPLVDDNLMKLNRLKLCRLHIKGKVPILVYIERKGRSWSRNLGSQPAGDSMHSHGTGGGLTNRKPLRSLMSSLFLSAVTKPRKWQLRMPWRHCYHKVINSLSKVFTPISTAMPSVLL